MWVPLIPLMESANAAPWPIPLFQLDRAGVHNGFRHDQNFDADREEAGAGPGGREGASSSTGGARRWRAGADL